MMKRNLLKITAIAMLLLTVAVGCKKDVNVTGVSLDKTSITLKVDEKATLTATVQPADATNPSVSWTSSNTEIAIVSNGTVTAKKAGTATVTVTTAEGNYTATCTVTVTPIGTTVTETGVTINGIKWATRNVAAPGTFAAKPEDAGMFYQWNRKKGWSATGEVTDWDATIPAGGTWEKANDPCPAGWRVPTKAEFESLLSTISVSGPLDELNGVTGCYFGSGEGRMFLPAAGFRVITGALYYVGSYGIYWSSTADGSETAYSMVFESENANMYANYRRGGYSVRCVAE